MNDSTPAVPATPDGSVGVPAALGFVDRHVGPRPDAIGRMLDVVGAPSLDALMDQAVPAAIRTELPTGPGVAMGEDEVVAHLRHLASRNRVLTSMIGLGYHGTHTPAAIRRNVLENPAWYTAYTPYQPEISQGRLEAALVFQTMVEDLTGLPVAGASLLDEATAVTEAVLLMRRAVRGKEGGVVVVDSRVLPQSLAVLHGRADAIGLPLVVADLTAGLPDLGDGVELVGVVVQQPGADGLIQDVAPIVEAAHEAGALVTVAADLLSLTLIAPPGEVGADVAVGSAQRFGVPMFYGGPHAAFMAVRSGLERQLPGRLVGVSVDADGAPAYRLSLQTREQHIRREKATSNICTAQALLAVVAAMYAVHHGPEGLRRIAEQVHASAVRLRDGLAQLGVEVLHDTFFDTVVAHVPGAADAVLAAAVERGINLRGIDADHVGLTTDETTTVDDVARALAAVSVGTGKASAAPSPGAEATRTAIPPERLRTSLYLTHPTFHRYRSETALMRYLRTLADKDLALDRTMIPLGSCTMKLNAAVELETISWPEFANLHPYAPADQAEGYRELVGGLEAHLADLTGYAAVSLQPNAGSQGELSGLLAIRAYHRSRGEAERDVCLIPASAHGTNAASAVLAGMRVVVVATAPDGTIDAADLDAKLAAHEGRVAAIMITYPSTHGVFEAGVRDVCDAVHAAGGQVYIDGANLNALVGLARPGEFGGDVSHLNLHKTFAIPHGGGGPGVGPVAVASHLVPFLPGDPTPTTAEADVAGVGPVAGARYGSAGVLPISYAYVLLMGGAGLRRASEVAILSANYLATRLNEHFPVLYTGPGGRVAHECILDLRAITRATGVTAEDVAKRLMDYGFHAPTLAFPVPGTLMVEPTESEDLAELDRFVEAMVAIRGEIARVEVGEWTAADSPLRGAPHTTACVVADGWDKPYSRETAAFGLPALRAGKYWPPVRRIDQAAGDRNLVCTCPPIEEYA
ncbi:aminomethyl-transferring glycine dehydrogenase [Isoptericola sp. b490]|uniref:aminomethyl-transferring glycine dehydrogenase n=1 Tax=Actinotalea lenta TaxID=3064654 RepID=UPI00271253E6|nr:aminomethyl-transferring glycine dehydrogenase [Isoptericola sp. b490]MDO8122196.1 aminomethyl-transferring glycine dehydrogenase [Isoptericola sp. b490]